MSLDDGMEAVVSLPSAGVISQSYNNKLVHLVGELRTDSLLSDTEFGVAIKAVKLKREVEMYQWRESQSTNEYAEEGGRTRVETTYSYSLVWSSELFQESRNFSYPHGHQNPDAMTVHSAVQVASTAYVGEFILSNGFVNQTTDFKELSPSEIPSERKYKLYEGHYYISENPSRPQAGDVRGKFSYAGYCGARDPQKVSVIAKQEGMMLRQYHTHSGYKIELLYPGNISAQEMLEAEVSVKTTLPWGYRLFGWILMFVGFLRMKNILTILVSWIPLVRNNVDLSILILSFSLSFSLFLFITAVGWFVHRPMLYVILIIIAIIKFKK